MQPQPALSDARTAPMHGTRKHKILCHVNCGSSSDDGVHVVLRTGMRSHACDHQPGCNKCNLHRCNNNTTNLSNIKALYGSLATNCSQARKAAQPEATGIKHRTCATRESRPLCVAACTPCAHAKRRPCAAVPVSLSVSLHDVHQDAGQLHSEHTDGCAVLTQDADSAVRRRASATQATLALRGGTPYLPSTAPASMRLDRHTGECPSRRQRYSRPRSAPPRATDVPQEHPMPRQNARRCAAVTPPPPPAPHHRPGPHTALEHQPTYRGTGSGQHRIDLTASCRPHLRTTPQKPQNRTAAGVGSQAGAPPCATAVRLNTTRAAAHTRCCSHGRRT